MDLDWSAADVRFREEVRDWLSENIPTEPRPGGTAGSDFDRCWQHKLFESGWAGINWPVAYGGRGLTLIQQMIWHEEYAKAGGPTPGLTFVATAHAGPTLIALGTEAQKTKHLNGILRGEELWCQGFSEPGSGSDLASLRTRGIVDGEHIIVSGQKIWTTGADRADYQELLIRTEAGSQRHKGLSWVICDMKSPGITVHPIRKMTGHAEFASVFYDDVRIPLTNVVGDVGQGWATAMATLGFERGTAFLAEMVTVTVKLEELFDLAKLVTGPSGCGTAWDDAEIRRKLGLRRAELAGLRAMNYANLSRYANGETPGAEGSIIKLYTNDTARAVQELALEILGPHLLDDDGPYAKWMKFFLDGIVLSIGGGTPEIQREIIADRVLELPRSR